MSTNFIIKSVSKGLLLLVLFGFITLSQKNTLQTEIKYKNYLNQKFGFSVDYPYEILIPQGESTSGDGQIFKSLKTPDNTLTVCRDYLDVLNPDIEFTLKVAYDKHVKAFSKKGNGRNITYKKFDKKFFVLSGYKDNGDIYYQKTMIIDGNLCSCLLEYKVADKALFNKISERVFKSFK